MNTDLMTLILADGLLLPIVAITLYALSKIPSGKRWQTLLDIVVAGLLTVFVAKIIGFIVEPAGVRPYMELGVAAKASHLGNPGFPSDHVLFATFLTTVVWWITRRWKVTAVMAAMTAAMGVGRVMGLVHTWADVAGGLVIGAVGLIWLYRHWLRRSLSRRAK